MKATQTARLPQNDRHPKDAHPPSFETIWNILQEIVQRQKETDIQIKEINRIIKEITHQKDTDQKTEENIEQFEEDELKEEIVEEKKRLWNKWVGESLYFGDIADYMLLPFLMKKFYKMGLNFLEAQPNYYVSDDNNQISVSSDFMMRNDDKVMLVKMEKELTTEHINEHIEQLENLRKYADLHVDKHPFLRLDKQIILGTVAGVVVTDEARNYALNQGLYLIEPSGISFSITPPQGKPKEW
jgi:hypothetical protein